MKTISSVLLIMIGMIFSCKNDEALSPESTINGNWNAKNITGGLAGVNIQYGKGEVTWTFNEANQTLTVLNNIDENKRVFLKSGTYTVKIEQNGTNQILQLNNTEYRFEIIAITPNLIISDGMNDGFTAEFNR